MNAVFSAFLSKQAEQMCFSSSRSARRLPVRLPSTLKLRLSLRLFLCAFFSHLEFFRSIHPAFICCVKSLAYMFVAKLPKLLALLTSGMLANAKP